MEVEPTKITLVMPVYNRRETTLRAVRSLGKVDRTGIDLKLIVVDDGSTDGTADALKNEASLDLEILQGDGTLHYAGGTNRGIEEALKWNADYIVTMNDDAVFHEHFLRHLLETAKNFPDAVIGSLLLLWDQPHRVFQVDPKWSVARGGWNFAEDLTTFTIQDKPFEVECIVGNCVLFPTAAIRQNGLMDEDNFPNGWGDAQYTVRMKRAGWRLLIDPKSKVWCEPNTYPTPLHKSDYKQQLNNVLVNRNHPSNLVRQFKALWHSAPNKAQAVAAFSVYTARLGMKAAGIMPPTGNGQGRS